MGIFDAYDESTKTNTSVSQCTRLIDYVVFVGRYDELHDAASSPFSSDNDVTENRRNFDFENTRMPILLRRLPYFDHDDFKLPLDVICFAQPEGCAILPTSKIILNDKNKIGNTYSKNPNNDPFDASISSNSTDNNSSSDESSRTVQLNHDNRNFPSSRENLDNIVNNQNYLSSNTNAYIDTSHREITTFVFTLTDKDSGRTRFGICLNYYQTIYSSLDKNQSKYTVTQTSMLSQEKVLTSLCILSHYPFFSTFRNLLILTKRLIDAGQQFCCDNFQRPGYRAEQIYWDLLTSYKPDITLEGRISHFESEEGIIIEPMICNILYAIENWLQRLLLSPVPIPEKTKLQLNVLPPFYEPQNLLFALPDSSRFCLIDFPLHLPLELLGIETCLKVLTCLVLEQKVVLQSRDHNALTMSVLALVAMIYPLEYMFPIIPLLPITLHGSEQLLLAPTPYFIGIPSSFLIYKGVNLPKDVWLVDLDTNKIVNPSGLELPPFPEPEGTILRTYLKQALHSMSIDPNLSSLNDDNPSSFVESNATIDKINSSHDSLQKNSSMASTLDRSIPQRNTENMLPEKYSFTQNSLLSQGDVDSVDMATRIAMVNFLDGPNVFSHFEDHCHILRLYPRPVVAFQIDSFIKSRPRPTRFVYELAKTQAFEYFAEWSLCPTNTAFQRVRIGITDPRLIGDKPKWYIHSLVPQNFSLLQSERIPRKILSLDTKSYEPESIITILFDHYYEQLRNNSDKTAKNYLTPTDKPMKIDVLTNQLITANNPKRYTSFSVGGLDEQTSSQVISDDDASIMALKPPSTVNKSVSSPEDDNDASNDDNRKEQDNQSSNTSTPSSNSEEISNSDSISSPQGSVPSSVPTLADSKIPFHKSQPLKENIPSHKRVSKQKPFFLNPSPRKKTTELLKYDQEKGLYDISTSEDTVSSNLPARRKNKSQRRVKNRGESTPNTYGDKISNSQNMDDLTALYIDHLQHERQSVGHPNMDYNALDNDEIDELLHRRPDLSSHSAVDQLDDIGDRLIQSFSTTINTLTLPRKLLDNYGKTFWFKSRQEVSMDHVLPYGAGGMDSELIEKTKKTYLDNGTKKLPRRLPRGDSANIENSTLAEQHIDYKRKPHYRSGEQINFTGVTRAPSVRSEMGPTKDARKSIDSESSEISLQNFLLDIAENVVNGQGVGWLKLPRLRNLLKHESCRLFLINKLNTNNTDTFVFPVRKLSLGAGKIIRTTSISSRREDSIDSMIDPHSPSYNEMTANFTKHLNELFDNKNQLLTHGKNFGGTINSENEKQRTPVNSVFSIKPKFISHVCLSKPVWKGYQTVLRCCLSGLEFTYANYGIGGMGSAYVFLEIISTHYYYTPVDEERDAKKQAEIERNDTSTPPLDMVENLRNQCSNIMIDPERTYKKLTRMGSKISQSITHAASNVLSNIDDKSTVNPVTNVATIANARSASPDTMMKMPKFRKEYSYESFLGKNRSKLWDESQFWQDIFLDAVSQERDMIGLDIGPGEMMNRFFHLSESERKRLESEEDNLLVIQLLNLIAFSVMMRVNVLDISRKVRRLLAKSHVGLKYSLTVNKILDAMPNYTANQIPLLLPLSRRIRKMSFTVKSGIDPNAEAMVMEICEDAIVFRSITSGEIIDKLWYDKLINMTLSPKNKVLCLWWKSGTKTYLQKFHTKKCQELYQAIRNIMERINNTTNNHRKVLGSEIGGQFEIGSLYTPDKGTLDISLDGVTIAFPDGKTTLHLDQIKKCRCQKNNKIFIFQIYG